MELWAQTAEGRPPLYIEGVYVFGCFMSVFDQSLFLVVLWLILVV